MDLQTILRGLEEHRDSIHEQNKWNNPVALSNTMTKLATYNAYLPDYIALLHKEATDAQFKAFLEAKKEGKSDTGAETYARGESTEARQNYEKIKFVYQATSELISVVQSRLRVLENARRESGAS